jgi:hypothetical protein
MSNLGMADKSTSIRIWPKMAYFGHFPPNMPKTKFDKLWLQGYLHHNVW